MNSGARTFLGCAALGLTLVSTMIGCSGSGSSLPASTTTLPVATSAATTSTTNAPTTAAASTTSTTTSTSTTATTTSVPQIVIPEGVPPADEVVNIVNQLYERITVLYSDPLNADVGTVCAPNSSCETTLNGAMDAMRTKQERRVGDEPVTVAYLRAVGGYEENGFAASFWSNPFSAGTIVSPEGSVPGFKSVEGAGTTFLVVAFPEDAAFPWRLKSYVPDPA